MLPAAVLVLLLSPGGILANRTTSSTEFPPAAGLGKHEERSGCGRSGTVASYRQPRTEPEGRLVNGKPAERGAWPWQASLEVLHPRYGLISHWCGAVLVSSQWLLTAAHCLRNEVLDLPLPALWTAVLGDWDREVSEDSEMRIPVDEIHIHQSFNNFRNDIALMKLTRPARGVPWVCLGEAAGPGLTCTATGWGRSQAGGGPLSTRLRQVKVPIQDGELCRKAYAGQLEIGEGHLCAGPLDGTVGACIGDSGGPLQCRRDDGRWYLAGITSFGSGCAKPGFPDVYTRLSHYLSWVRGTIHPPPARLNHLQPT